ncbi:MAG: glycosyltransferase [Actinomycetota bacterium]|nr:glycosyltransferase [Actinomycetota bacterium]
MSAPLRAAIPGGVRTLSVVVPCHDYGRFLPDALGSIAAQTRPADEVLVVDDGSADETLDVARAFAERWPACGVLSRAPARGAVATFNDGVRATGGELVVILSADDVVAPNYLEALEARLVGTEASFAYSGVRYFGSRSGSWPARPFDPRRLARANFVNGSAMFTRELFEQVGGFDAGFDRTGMEDWAFWVAALSRGATGVPVPDTWLGYRRHEGGSRNSLPVRSLLAVHRGARRRWPEVVTPRALVEGIALDLVASARVRLLERAGRAGPERVTSAPGLSGEKEAPDERRGPQAE